MRLPYPTLVFLFCACACAKSAAATNAYSPPPFGHYQPILDRMPFGLPPAAVDTSAAPSPTEAQQLVDQQKLAKQVNMSLVNITPDGQTAIGFTDLSAKPPVSHYLLVGASADGWTVLSADYDEETATIQKDGVTITLKLGKGLVDPSSPPPAAGVPAPGTPPPPMLPSLPTSGLRSLKGNAFRPVTLPPPPSPALSQPAARAALPPPPAATAEASAESRSYRQRLLERKSQQTEEQLAAAKRQHEQLAKLAEAAAQRELARRDEAAAQAAEAAAEAAAQGAPQEEQPMEAAPEPAAEPAAPVQEGDVQ